MIEFALQLAGGIRSTLGSPQTTLQTPVAVIPWLAFTGWQQPVAGLWAVGIIGVAVALLLSITQLRKAANNDIPGQADEAKTRAVRAGSVLLGLLGSGAILTTIFAIAS